MSRHHDTRYDEIKSLVNKARILKEQAERVNIAKSIENRIKQDTDYETADSDEEKENENVDDKVQKYRISGGILALHGKDREQLQITSDDKLAFQETMDEFIEEVDRKSVV